MNLISLLPQLFANKYGSNYQNKIMILRNEIIMISIKMVFPPQNIGHFLFRLMANAIFCEYGSDMDTYYSSCHGSPRLLL